MQVWGWLIAYVVGFGLLQLFLYKYFQHRGPSPESAPGGLGRASGDGQGTQQTAVAAPGINCPHCGARNETHQMIRYCGDCTQQLR